MTPKIFCCYNLNIWWLWFFPNGNVSKTCRRNSKQCKPWSDCKLISVYTACQNSTAVLSEFLKINHWRHWIDGQSNLSHHTTKPSKWCASSEGSDQPGHPLSLIRVFAVRMKKPRVLSFSFSAPQRLWSDWVDASLHWARRPFCWFCRAQAYLSWASQYSHVKGEKKTNWSVKFIEIHNHIIIVWLFNLKKKTFLSHRLTKM